MDQPSDCQSSPQSGMSHEESLERPDAWADTTNKKAGSLKMNPWARKSPRDTGLLGAFGSP
jgi:hypothetical protein